MDNPSNWITVAESRFAWELAALDFVRQRFPAHEPYRAWSNFEFIAEDGSINEVDLLVFTPQGFFLVEIKSRPGRLYGDEGTWTWETDGRLTTQDNPLFAANAKAKRLRSLLERQRAFKHKERPPFLEALVFCSDPDLRCDLADIARYRVCLRDREPEGAAPERKGIMAAFRARDCPGLDPVPRGTHDRVMGRQIAQALEQAGIRPTQGHRRVSDFLLGDLIEEGAGYQDRAATHVRFPDVRRRVRLYLVRATASREDRETIQRAAQREFQLLEKLQHPNILRTYGFTEHELGPAIIFGHDPQAVRLDHYLAQKGEALGVDVPLALLRQIAEAVRFAHDKKVVHRALSPQSILVTEEAAGPPRVLIYNWQAGYYGTGSASGSTGQVRATNHVDRLVDDISTAYMAPEALADEANTGEHLDVFSLGAIAYHLFSGRAPAANGLELSAKLRETRGLRISAVMNGAGEFLQTLIQYSTHPDTASRMDSVAEFLGYLDEVENELTTPERETAFDPARAQQGELLPGGFTVVKRLGQGASAVALLVERQGQEYVLKAANDPAHNARIEEEAAIIRKLRHPYIVEHCETLQVGDRAAFLMRPVLVERERDTRRVETLGQRLRQEGRLHIDLLQRFGEDLLEAVNHLEEQGIPHRDIKPDNIVLGKVGRGDRLHLVLFDFSLSPTPPANIRAGTAGYLDPLLALRTPPRWDLHAERYAAAVTLYEMATGALPVWGDGVADPSHLDCEITLDPELLDTGLRDSLTEFFQHAFRRDVARRFDNAEEMLRAWRRCFAGIEAPGALSEEGGEEALRGLLMGATLETELAALRLGARAANALDRANLLTVKDLLTTPVRRLMRLRGVGNKTRREILAAVRILRETLDAPPAPSAPSSSSPSSSSSFSSTHTDADSVPPQPELGSLSVDLLYQNVTRANGRDNGTARRALNGLLGLEEGAEQLWPGQADVARQLGVSRARRADRGSRRQPLGA